MPSSDAGDRRAARPRKKAKVLPSPTAAQNRKAFAEIRKNVAKQQAAKAAVRPNPDQQRGVSKGPSVATTRRHNAERKQAIVVVHDRVLATNRKTGNVPKGGTERPYKAPHHSLLSRTLHLLYPSGGKGSGSRLATAQGRVPTAAGSIPALAAKNTALSIVEHPIKQTKRIPGDLAKSAIAIPAGLYGVARDPKHGASMVVKDYERRYGPLTKGPAGEKEFRRRQAKEGVTAEVLDYTGAAAAGGATLGRGLQVAARAGRLGKKLERVAVEPRPGLQVSAGKAVKQDLSPNLLVNATKKAQDRRRAVALDKRLARRGGEAKDLVDVEAKKKGNVRPGNVPVVGAQRRAQLERKDLAKLNSSSRVMMKGELQRTALTLEKDIARKLTADEQRGLTAAVKFGIKNPDQAKRVLARYIASIEKERAGAEAAGKPVSLTKKTDQLPELRKLLADADRAFTPRTRALADEYREMSRKAGGADPSLDVAAMEARAIKPLAEMHGVTYRQAEKKGAAAKRKRAAVAQETRARRALTTAERKAAREQGRAEVKQTFVDAKALRADPEYRKAAAAYSKALAKRREADKRYGNLARDKNSDTGALSAAVVAKRQASERAAAASAQFRKVKAETAERAAKATTKAAAKKGAPRPAIAALGRQAPSRLRALSDAESLVAKRKLEMDRATRARKNVLKQQPAEAPAAFVARAKAAIPSDLAEPGYFRSEKRNDSPFGAFTRGSGKDAKAKDKQYGGSLNRTGREASDPSVLSRSVAKNISRRYNWEFIRQNIRDGSPEWARNQDRSFLVDEAERRGLDPASYVLVRNKLIEKDAKLADKADTGSADVTDTGDFDTQASIHASLKANTVAGEHARSSAMDLSQNPGWTLMSKNRFKEMESNATPSGAGSRSFQVAKGKVSRVLLGTPGWLQFQVAANALLSGIAGTGPIDLVKAQLYFRRLEKEHPEQYAELQAMTGIEPYFDEQTRLGATANNRIVNAWRAMKQTGFYNHALNPTTVPRRTLDVLFRADNLQNNAFRKAVLYSQVKRDTYARMGASAHNIIRTQAEIGPSLAALGRRAAHLKDLGPTERMAVVLKDQAAMERHAKYVNDFLGDYMTYTARERRFIGRSIMFFGFMRFSVKFTLYTMPVRHPIVTAMLAQLGRMQTDELERIFGTKPPPWELANWFSKDGKKRMNIARLIPFFNATSYFDFDSGSPNIGPSAYGSLPPYAQILGNYAFARDMAKDKPRTTNGDDFNFNGKQLTVGERNKVALAEAANVVPLFRLLTKTGIPGIRKPDEGAQASDSSLFTPDARRYKDPAKVASNEKAKAAQRARNPLVDFFAPILPSDGSATVRSTQDYARAQGKPVGKPVPAPRRVAPVPQDAIDAALDAIDPSVDTSGIPDDVLDDILVNLP